MKILNKLIRFFGGVIFAILLIAITALFVIAGTFIESITDSHSHAALFTYDNPIFSLLLWGFFVNILISALRRFPFKLKHIPFLITHLGLLMILGGVIVKSYTGVQGYLTVIEGSASQELFLANSDALLVETAKTEDKNVKFKSFYPIPYNKIRGKKLATNSSDPSFADLEIKLLSYTPNAFEKLETWVKKENVHLMGMQPFKITELQDLDASIPLPKKTIINGAGDYFWHVYGIRSDHVNKIAQKVYLESTHVILTDSLSGKSIWQGPLKQFVTDKVVTPYGNAKGELSFSWEEILGFQNPNILLKYQNQQIEIALQGENALLNRHRKEFLGKAAITLDLVSIPTILFVQDAEEDVFVFAFDANGQVHSENFRQDNLQTIIAYNEGFAGYTVQAKLPFLKTLNDRTKRENEALHALMLQLKQGYLSANQLSAPLKIINQACQKCKTDFADTTIAFLEHWNKAGGWLYSSDIELEGPVKSTMQSIDWNSMSESIRKACFWTACLFDRLEPLLKEDINLIEVLEKLQWPMIESLKMQINGLGTVAIEEWPTLLNTITHQIFAAADQLPATPTNLTSEESARLLSVYLRAYSIHLHNILPSYVPPDLAENQISLECPLTVDHQPVAVSSKFEDNTPRIILQVKCGNKTEIVSAGYQRYGSGIKWPILDGQFLVRFQPLFKQLPYRLRLRQARQINYANSQQPLSFESDFIIKDLRGNSELEKTISMNHVHETWDGYRFYLANISPPQKGALKHVQIAVNHDPAKYFLTYPGALILSLGILLLFWFWPYK